MRALGAACAAHALHDGLTDAIYVLLPVWQGEFALAYGVLALLRGLYAGTMALLQIPAGRLAERLSWRAVLASGTALTGIGYALAGLSGSLLALGAALVLAGAGASTQHPIASSSVSHAFGVAARGPLGVYNFAGDLGKAAIPAFLSLLLTALVWRHALWILALLALAMALALRVFMPPGGAREKRSGGAKVGRGRGGFPLLLAIGMLDSGVRMGLLTFLPFLLKVKGAPLPTVGLALALVFLGGAVGKFACGWLGERFGVLATVLLTEAGTAILIVAVLLLSLAPALVVLLVLGVMLNGTSSVLYGTVPELAPAGRVERSFALFYTGTIGSGALSPVFYGLIGDALGLFAGTLATAAVALAICPLVVVLAPRLAPASPSNA